jgi:hypothetical protein
MKEISCIEEARRRTADVIDKILKHLGLDQPADPHSRSPPATLFDYSTNLF